MIKKIPLRMREILRITGRISNALTNILIWFDENIIWKTFTFTYY